jgi:hypothetical protein
MANQGDGWLIWRWVAKQGDGSQNKKMGRYAGVERLSRKPVVKRGRSLVASVE